MPAFEQDGMCRIRCKTLGCHDAEPAFICAKIGAIGPIQCSPGATTYWKGCQGFPKVLDGGGDGGFETFTRRLTVAREIVRIDHSTKRIHLKRRGCLLP